MTKRYALRIVIPVLNEGAVLTAKLAALQSLRQQGADIEFVLVDGGSLDESWARARPWVNRLISSPAGRARQMNAGAADTQTSQADALLFLHADTQLPPDAYATILRALQHQPWGRFDVKLASSDPRLRLVAAMMNLRSRLTGIATGDQAMFVKAALFQVVGGFPDQPLMEDIELSKRLKKHALPACLREKVITSARRWEKGGERGGIWRTVALMWRLRWAYFWGAAPEKLALIYGYKAAPPVAAADVAILAKAPVPGLAKTRLIPLLGAKGAARQQRQFLKQSLHTAQQANLGRITLWCAPHAQQPTFRALARAFGLQCLPQPQGDLGERMRYSMVTHFEKKNAPPLLIIGTDCAVLAPGHLQEAARKLQAHDACLIPAEDGGYVLIGLRRPVPEVFEQIDWSTDRVMVQTRERLRLSGATWAELLPLWDIDEPSDWQRWQAMSRLESKNELLT